jgi:hypothetical protein
MPWTNWLPAIIYVAVGVLTPIVISLICRRFRFGEWARNQETHLQEQLLAAFFGIGGIGGLVAVVGGLLARPTPVPSWLVILAIVVVFTCLTLGVLTLKAMSVQSPALHTRSPTSPIRPLPGGQPERRVISWSGNIKPWHVIIVILSLVIVASLNRLFAQDPSRCSGMVKVASWITALLVGGGLVAAVLEWLLTGRSSIRNTVLITVILLVAGTVAVWPCVWPGGPKEIGPDLFLPGNKEVYRGPETAPVLKWKWHRDLDANEWYHVVIECTSTDPSQPTQRLLDEYTREEELRLDGRFREFIGFKAQRDAFKWFVVVETIDKEAVSYKSKARTFIWRGVPEPLPESPTPTPTDTPEHTPTAEPAAEPTLEPTAEPTLEPTAEPTLEPTAEPTATLEPAPDLESPGNGTPLGGGRVTLRWKWDRDLKPDEHFDVRVWRDGEPQGKSIAWTKQLWYPLKPWYEEGWLGEGTFHWSIQVLLHTDTRPDSTKAWDPVSEESEVHWFTRGLTCCDPEDVNRDCWINEADLNHCKTLCDLPFSVPAKVRPECDIDKSGWLTDHDCKLIRSKLGSRGCH